MRAMHGRWQQFRHGQHCHPIVTELSPRPGWAKSVILGAAPTASCALPTAAPIRGLTVATLCDPTALSLRRRAASRQQDTVHPLPALVALYRAIYE
jgi:hypothetical protein